MTTHNEVERAIKETFQEVLGAMQKAYDEYGPSEHINLTHFIYIRSFYEILMRKLRKGKMNKILKDGLTKLRDELVELYDLESISFEKAKSNNWKTPEDPELRQCPYCDQDMRLIDYDDIMAIYICDKCRVAKVVYSEGDAYGGV